MQVRTLGYIVVGIVFAMIGSGSAQAQPAEATNLHRHILETKRGMNMEEAIRFYQTDFHKLDTSGCTVSGRFSSTTLGNASST